MTSEWREVKLAEILGKSGYIRGPFGSALRRGELSNSGVPVYEQQHAISNSRAFRYFISEEKYKELSRFAVKENDLIISCSGTLGKVSIIGKDDPRGIISQALLILRPDIEKALPKFLYYFLCSPLGYQSLGSVSSGSVQVNIAKRSIIEDITLRLPPLPKQRAIAHILSTLDDKIELNRSMNQTLDAMAQAIFKSCFMDFEPFRNQGMQDSPLGEIPIGWRTQPLDKVADFLNGLALQEYPPEGEDYLPVIKIAEIRRGITESSGRASPFINKEYIVEDGDILFSWSGSLEVCIWCGGKGALNQHLFKVTSIDYPKWFYYHWIKYHLPEFQAIAAGKATTMGHIQRYHLSSTLVLIPPKNILETMDKTMSPLLDGMINNSLESRILATIRDTILPKLLSGKIRVKEAEKFIGRFA
jgi:type I restriction enzyme S subunit